MTIDAWRCARKFVLGVACVCLLDVVLGGISRTLFFAQRSGKFYRINRAMTSADARLFIFGSSHAASHYVPDVLEKELGMSCYNAGVLGQQILFHKALQSVILQRVTPDVIVLDVDPRTLYESSQAYDRLSDLKPFYFRYPDLIGPVLARRSRLERLFLQSRLYQYNSTIVHVIRYAVSPQPDWNGYRPEYEAMRAPTLRDEQREIATSRTFDADRRLDPLMVEAMEGFAADALRRGVRVFFFVSPRALPDDLASSASFLRVRAIADYAHVPLVNFRNHPEFLRHYTFFYDAGHLNDAGARVYSRLVADTIRKSLAAGPD